VILFIAIQQIGLLPAFSQSRKDQIEILFSQKDSLLQTLSKEREMAEKYKNEQEQLIISLKNNINEVEFKVTQANKSIDEKNKNLKNLQNQIITLIDSVNSIKEKLDIIKNENLKIKVRGSYF
jgi:chromosome segregation ATPase